MTEEDSGNFDKEKFNKMYAKVANKLSEFFKNEDTDENRENLGNIFLQLSFKCFIMVGLNKEEYLSFFKGYQRNFDGIYDSYFAPAKDEPLFSEGLRKAMEPFKDRDVSDCIKDPAWYKALLKHAGNSSEEADKIMADIKSRHKG